MRCLYSGASRHIEKERTAFITYSALKTPIPIQLGDDSEILAIGVGTIRKHVKTATGVDTMHFTRTLHAPKLAGSLLSVGQLTAMPGVKLEFEGSLCLIKLRGKTLCQASFVNGLYALHLANTASSPSSYPSVLKAKTLIPAGNSGRQGWSMGWTSGLGMMISRARRVLLGRLRASRSQMEEGDVL
ncbi:hypothetical protein DFH08DRAFT_1039184, partial [Mycena albidolilacea]